MSSTSAACCWCCWDTTYLNLVSWRMIAASWKCASSWVVQLAGRLGQNGGRRVATRYTSALCVSSTGPIVLKSRQFIRSRRLLLPLVCRAYLFGGHQYMCGYARELLNSATHITVFNRVLVVHFDVKTILLLCHDIVTFLMFL